MTVLWRDLLGSLWLATAAFFTWAAIGQVGLMLAPPGSDAWRHSEWAMPAATLCVALAIPYLISALGLFFNWRWQRLWTYAPLLPFGLLIAWLFMSART